MWFIQLLVLWAILPMILVLSRGCIPLTVRLFACWSFVGAAWRTLVVTPFSLLAPIAVLLILPFVPRSANQLPAWCRAWDNDVSINGDKPEYWDPAYTGVTYYANAHPRSFWARWVWLGWRNRASWLALRLGYTYTGTETRELWGDADTSRSHAGWVLYRCGPIYQVYATRKVGPICLRANWGRKVWGTPDGRKTAMVVAITLTAVSWQGA